MNMKLELPDFGKILMVKGQMRGPNGSMTAHTTTGVWKIKFRHGQIISAVQVE
jgi:hypothetical protein